MGTSHEHAAVENGSRGEVDRRLIWSAALNAAVTLLEVVVGLVAGSVALLADAVHNFGDLGALLLVLGARRIGRRPYSGRHTYGLRRVETLAGLANALVMLALAVPVALEAFRRFFEPREVMRGPMLAAATVALAANLLSVALLRRHAHGDLNVRGAVLHLMQDALASIAVIVAALCAALPGGRFVDPIAALLVAGIVAHGGVALGLEAVHVLVEGSPRGLDVEAMVAEIDRGIAPASLHHVHVWEVGPGQRVLTAHVVVGEVGLDQCTSLLARIRAELASRWGIDHVTLEPEPCPCDDEGRAGIPKRPPAGAATERRIP